MSLCKRATSIHSTIQKVRAQQQGTTANLLFLLAQLDSEAESQGGEAGELSPDTHRHLPFCVFVF